MDEYKCSCGQIFETPEEYLTHLKEKIRQQNEQTMKEEAGILTQYYNEVGL